MAPGSAAARHPASQEGYALVIMLLVAAAASAAAAAVAVSWTNDVSRAKEDELLMYGDLYAKAIAAYYNGSPGTRREYPRTLDQLLEDRRLAGLRRHLRRLYPDPLARERPWGLIRAADGGVVGVYSQSQDAPWRRGPIMLDHTDLPAARRYSDWMFVARVQWVLRSSAVVHIADSARGDSRCSSCWWSY